MGPRRAARARVAPSEGARGIRDGVPRPRGTELAAAERVGRELIALAPYRESGHRLLIEGLAARGNLAEALRAYDDLRTLLREKLGIAPGPEMQRLHATLVRAR